MLSHRVFITYSPTQYLEVAAVFEFSIIAVDPLEYPIVSAATISRAWTEMRLKEKQPCVLRLLKQGSHTIEAAE
jgi:hypothetical protein